MNPTERLFSQTLKENGYSVTKSRRAVFLTLQGSEPLSVSQIISRTLIATDRASVYRTITLFEKLGITQRLQIGWKYKIELSDKFHSHHHHLTCLECGKIKAFKEIEELERLIHTIAQSHNFHLTDHQVELQGVCSNCQKNSLKKHRTPATSFARVDGKPRTS